MAVLEFTPIVSSHRTNSAQAVMRAAAAPTASYVASTNVMSTSGWEYVVVSVTYVNGDETTVQIVPQLYDGTAWADAGFKATQGSAVSEITSDVLQLTKATWSTRYGAGTTGTVALPPISVIGAQQFRVLVKAVGGTPTGTIGFTATAGVTVKN